MMEGRGFDSAQFRFLASTRGNCPGAGLWVGCSSIGFGLSSAVCRRLSVIKDSRSLPRAKGFGLWQETDLPTLHLCLIAEIEFGFFAFFSLLLLIDLHFYDPRQTVVATTETDTSSLQ